MRCKLLSRFLRDVIAGSAIRASEAPRVQPWRTCSVEDDAMAAHRRSSSALDTVLEGVESLDALQSPKVMKDLERLRKRYARRVTPFGEVRAMLDEALGDRSLTEELYRMRGCLE